MEGAVAGSAADEAALRRRALNVIGHELRTPMTTLRGLAETLSFATVEQIRGEVAPAMQRVARRVEDLLDDLLIAGGISTALPTTPPVTAVPAAIVTAIWSRIGDGAALPIEGDVAATVRTGEQVLDRALTKILDNARKYATASTVVIAADSGGVTITVRSEGPPLHPEEVRLSTALFYRGERAVTTAPGLGIGLAVAKSLVEHAGGHLTFADRPGGGAITTVWLPGETGTS